MAITIKEATKAFQLFYEAVHDRDFRKTLELNQWKEQDLLPLVRTFLLGYFGHCYPEVQTRLASSATGFGRFDFQIGEIAIELAVRRPLDAKGPISSKFNRTEMIKLMMYDGPSLLILFDFSGNPFAASDIERFKEYPSLGRGNYKKYPFNVAYFYIENARKREYGCLRRRIRVSKRKL